MDVHSLGRDVPPQNSGSCCFEPISHDLQARLKKAQWELNLSKETNSRLKEDLATKSREVEHLQCDTGQTSDKRQNAEDHSSIFFRESEHDEDSSPSI